MQPVHVFPGTLFVIACLVNLLFFFFHFPNLRKWHISGWQFGTWLSDAKIGNWHFGTWLTRSHLPLGSMLIKIACDFMRKRQAENWVSDTAKALEAEGHGTLTPEDQGHLTALIGKALAPTEHAMGRTIAFIEELLYMYSAFAQIESIFSGVLLFKAFYTWISSDKPQIRRPAVPATYSDKVKDEFARFCNSRSHMLVKFYEYAIGNFISLGIALFCYLLVTKVSFHCPDITNWTTFPQWFGATGFGCMLDPGRGK